MRRRNRQAIERAEWEPLLMFVRDGWNWLGKNGQRDAMMSEREIELEERPTPRGGRQARQNPHPMPAGAGIARGERGFADMLKACRSVRRTAGGRFLFRGSNAGSSARQNRRTGQSSQRGRRGRQIIAPRSIKAGLWSRAPFARNEGLPPSARDEPGRRRCQSGSPNSLGAPAPARYWRRRSARADRTQSWRARRPCSARCQAVASAARGVGSSPPEFSIADCAARWRCRARA